MVNPYLHLFDDPARPAVTARLIQAVRALEAAWEAGDLASAALRELEDRAEAVGVTLDQLLTAAEEEWDRRDKARRQAEARETSPLMARWKHNDECFARMVEAPGTWVHVGHFRSQGTAQNWRDKGCEVRVIPVGSVYSIDARRPALPGAAASWCHAQEGPWVCRLTSGHEGPHQANAWPEQPHEWAQ